MSITNFIQVKARFSEQDQESGKVINVQRTYLVEAVETTEAVARFTEEAMKIGNTTFDIHGTSNNIFNEIFLDCAGELFWKIKYNYKDEDEKTGKVKTFSGYALINGDTINDAIDNFNTKFETSMLDYSVVSAGVSNISDVFVRESE